MEKNKSEGKSLKRNDKGLQSRIPANPKGRGLSTFTRTPTTSQAESAATASSRVDSRDGTREDGTPARSRCQREAKRRIEGTGQGRKGKRSSIRKRRTRRPLRRLVLSTRGGCERGYICTSVMDEWAAAGKGLTRGPGWSPDRYVLTRVIRARGATYS